MPATKHQPEDLIKAMDSSQLPAGNKHPVFKALLPADASIIESTIADAQSPIFPEEEAMITNAVDKRRYEFIAGRSCLRAAFAKLGLPLKAIEAGPMRNPILPLGYSGSITHTGEHAAAAAIAKGNVSAIGIDIECASPLEDKLIDLILSREEQAHVEKLAEKSGTSNEWAKVIFSAKEAFYKAYFQIAGSYLDFLQADFRLHPEQQAVEATLLIEAPTNELINQPFFGKYCISNKHVYSAFCL